MSKVTKMQINRVRERLEKTKAAKMDAVRDGLALPTDYNVIEVGLEWAGRQPTKMVNALKKATKKAFHGGDYLRLIEFFRDDCPEVAKLQRANENLALKNKTRLMNASKKLDKEIEKILDSLYFVDNPDVAALIADFEKLSV